MEHIAALLLIIGCSGSADSCRELPAPTTVFETSVECDEQLPVSKRQFEGRFDKVLATCIQLDPALEYEDAELVWDITPEGELVASIEPMTDYVVASNAHERAGEYANEQHRAR